MKIKGAKALITGASSGFGKALAIRLAELGAKVFLIDVSKIQGEQLEREINQKFGQGVAKFQVCDVSDMTELRKAFLAAKNEFGTIHLCFNNAGVGGGNETANLFEGEIETETGQERSWTKVIDINFQAVLYGTVLATKIMKHNPEGGVIVNTASIAGLYPGMPILYGASKYGVVGITQNLAYLFQRYSIRVVAVAPYFSETNLVKKMQGTKIGQKILQGTNYIPVSLVVDAFIKAVEDDTLIGDVLTVTPKKGISKYKSIKKQMTEMLSNL